jgi:uncharacterized protein YjdB
MGLVLSRVGSGILNVSVALALLASSGCRGAELPIAPQLPTTGAQLFTLAIAADTNAVAVGQRLTLALEGQDDNGLPVAVAGATWKSSDTKLATVDARGTVTGVARGRVTITATTKNPAREATLTLQVLGAGEAPSGGTTSSGGAIDPSGGGFGTDPTDVDPDPAGVPVTTPAPAPNWPASNNTAVPAPDGMQLAVYPLNTRVTVGERLRLVAYQGFPGSQAPAAAIWQSADEDIATVDEAGMVTGKRSGAVRVLATSVAYPALTQEFTLTVVAKATSEQIQGVRISPSAVSMNVGETFWLLAEVPTNTGSYDTNIRWVAGDPGLISVSETGQLTALAAGKTTVTAIAATYGRGELSATIPVEIRNASSSR